MGGGRGILAVGLLDWKGGGGAKGRWSAGSWVGGVMRGGDRLRGCGEACGGLKAWVWDGGPMREGGGREGGNWGFWLEGST